ncbi:MAG: signal recognition particle protein [Anaerolinea sp. 4484_236]|nr:MAG: signal recognition particle protein [Anaerolinea sp. 4484_236]OQY37263.1 MAG: signal recognition particle protein [Anaerolineaceae bacterium 4572_5.2]RLD04813.1 MAG: signal recognition particle protein [Chloroflexota bacterium]
MFENLADRLDGIFRNLRRRGKLSERDVDSAMREIRLALLEADVHYGVVRDFVSRVKERAIGHEVSKALNPGQQIIKIVHEELIDTLGDPAPLDLRGQKPKLIMLIGLQGAGKTTAAGKLASKLRKEGERVLLVAADPYRPAAVKQLETLGKQLTIPVFFEADVKPPVLAQHALEKAKRGGFSVAILDTAGRSQLDEGLMSELQAINQKVDPTEILLVVDAMIGQEALNVAQSFRDAVPITGLIMSKMDGDARGGAAISIRSVTEVPIKFLGTGESLKDLETYDPSRLASRILGMGDVIGLIERAEDALDEEVALQQAGRMMAGEFTLEDFAQQIAQVRKMGPIGKIMEMLPGQMGQMAKNVSPQDAEDRLVVTEAIINSMTIEERQNPKILNARRRQRIAKGSGTQVYDVNQLVKQYRDAQRLFKKLGKSGMGNLSQMFG